MDTKTYEIVKFTDESCLRILYKSILNLQLPLKQVSNTLLIKWKDEVLTFKFVNGKIKGSVRTADTVVKKRAGK